MSTEYACRCLNIHLRSPQLAPPELEKPRTKATEGFEWAYTGDNGIFIVRLCHPISEKLVLLNVFAI